MGRKQLRLYGNRASMTLVLCFRSIASGVQIRVGFSTQLHLDEEKNLFLHTRVLLRYELFSILGITVEHHLSGTAAEGAELDEVATFETQTRCQVLPGGWSKGY
ncbi:hypothetical protein JEQ12_003172 [Ovis aries]|uniref:Uncharacterized protein n=1 Tax=Ovis aries TaxID=9940 RepID=A0A836A9F6_SHEEP|nr:hypothetical protein JEQ12_003172 [Ovis aries]